MPFAVNGVYTPATGATTAAPGQIIHSAIWNGIFSDLSSSLTLLGQQLYNQTTVNFAQTPYTPLSTDTLLLVVSNGGAITILLPSALSRNGYPLGIKDSSGLATSNNITIIPNGADTIEGLTSISISANYGGYELTPVAGGWIIAP